MSMDFEMNLIGVWGKNYSVTKKELVASDMVCEIKY